MEELRLLHNPRCSKSRAARALLEASGRPFEVVEYLQDPLDEGALRQLFAKLGTDDPRAIIRTKEAAYAEQDLDHADADTLLRALAKTPALLERPIAICGERAVIARPPEQVGRLFD